MPWYAVYPGHRPGIYREWYGPHGALAASSGYRGEQHPKFPTHQQAVEWLIAQVLGIKKPIPNPRWEELAPGQVRLSVTDGKSKGGAHSDIHQGRIDVGRWGEEYAFRALVDRLTRQYGQSQNFIAEFVNDAFMIYTGQRLLASLHWRNSQGETNISPDIILLEADIEKFIEVKSTAADYNEFSLTPNEWLLAKEKGENFCLAVVKRANTPEATISEIWNPYQLYRQAVLRVTDKTSIQKSDARIQDKKYHGYGEHRDVNGKVTSRVEARVRINGRRGCLFMFRQIKRKLRFDRKL